MKRSIDTGAIGSVKTVAPRFGSGRQIAAKPTAMAIHDGETEDDVRAFAQHLCDAWDAYRAKRRGGWLL